MGHRKVIAVLASSVLWIMVNAQNDRALIVKGNEHYKKQEFDKAAEAYRQAAQVNEKNYKAQFNLGNALYKQNKRDDAAKVFGAAAQSSMDKSSMARAYYNQGVSFTRDQKLMESIDAYKESLRKNSTDQEARENLQKALNELKKQQEQQQQNKNQDKNKNKDQDDEQQPQQNKSKLNKNQVERMLNALRQEEQRLQQSKQAKTKAGGTQEKDW